MRFRYSVLLGTYGFCCTLQLGRYFLKNCVFVHSKTLCVEWVHFSGFKSYCINALRQSGNQ